MNLLAIRAGVVPEAASALRGKSREPRGRFHVAAIAERAAQTLLAVDGSRSRREGERLSLTLTYY
jgi:hypothetical protein